MTTTDHFAGDPRTNHERMLAGDLYVSDDPDIAVQQQRAITLQARFAAAFADDVDAAQAIARELFGSLHETAHVRAPVFVDYGSHVTIGADCQIGPNVQLLTPTHPVEPQPRRDKLEAAKPITIGDNVWLGGGVVVLPGVTIGENSVVGAGAVVTKDVPADVVAVGNPARVVRSL